MSRSFGLREALTLGLGAAGALAAWGVLVEPRLISVERHPARVPGLPPAWHGRRVALFADPQLGMRFGNADTARRVVARILRERPALVLLAGDLVYKPARAPERRVAEGVDLLRPLVQADLPTYVVLGNHDYAATPDGPPPDEDAFAVHLREALEAAGVHVLTNDAVPLPSPDGTAAQPPLYLVGIGDHGRDQDHPRRAIRKVPEDAPRLVLMHNPRSYRTLPSGSAPLALAGHTHGGQIRFPLVPAWTPSQFLKDWPGYVDGWIEGYGAPGNRLYVNRGIGFSLLPVRIGTPPELTLLTLQPA